MPRRISRPAALIALLAAPALALAQPASTPPPETQPPSILPAGAPGSNTTADPLGPYFESGLHGIAFRPPAGSKQIQRVTGDEIVQFVNDQRKWSLRVSKSQFSKPIALTSNDPNSPGYLELATAKLKETPSAELLRSDVTNVGSKGAPDTGLITIRLTRGTSNLLAQQAIVQLTEQYYYVLEFTSPGSKVGSGADQASDEEREAIKLFSSIVDTVRLYNRSDVRADQDERLLRTQNLFINWTPDRVRKTLVPERWFRLIQDGKDVGYTYVVEEETERGGRKGVLIGVRSRSVPAPGEQVDTESFLFAASDRKYEEWSNVAQVNTKEGKKPLTELGAYNVEDRRVLDPEGRTANRPAPDGDPNQPAVRNIADRVLTVTYSGRAASAPIQMRVGVSYLPQALGHLLPRLCATTQPTTYLFATYVSDQRAVMRRYVDVLPERDVKLGDRQFRAIPITDRIGLEGIRTTHYVTRDGQYLGATNEAAKILILPSDAESIQKIWAQVDTSRPKPPASLK